MDYEKHYNRLISRAQDRILDIYTEKHHIIPRCAGGSDDFNNLVALTPEEHYVAHQLLCKMPIYISIRHKLIYAASMMTVNRKSNKLYGWLSRERAKHLRELNTGRKQSAETIALRVAKTKGLKRSNETREKIRQSKLGVKRKPFSDEHKQKLDDARKSKPNPMSGRTHSAESRNKISKGNTGKIRSEELKDQISRKLTGRVFTKDTIHNMSIGAKAGWENCLPENRDRGKTGRKFSEETKQKISAAAKERWRLKNEKHK